MNKAVRKGKARIGNMGMIPRASCLDTRIRICILTHVIVPTLNYAGEVRERNVELVKGLATVQMAPAKEKTSMLQYDE